MKKKIGVICLIIFVLSISISCIVLSIPTLNNEITDFQQYIEAIFMFTHITQPMNLQLHIMFQTATKLEMLTHFQIIQLLQDLHLHIQLLHLTDCIVHLQLFLKVTHSLVGMFQLLHLQVHSSMP